MDFFNQITKHSLNAFFQNTSSFKLIILWGHRGGGKTYTAHSVLLENHIKTKDIIFSEDNMLPFNFQDNLESYFLDEDAILVQCSQLFRENYCLFFQNMEFCDLDSQRLLYKLIKYHKNNNQKSYVILEYNVTEKPADRLCLLSEDILFIGLPPKSDFDEYYAAHFAPSPITKELYERILKITQGNIQNFFSVIKILQYIGILCKNDQGLYFCKNSAYKMPDSLLDLYVDLFDGLKEYLREPLISTAPFSKQIYSTIIQGIYHNYDMFEEYLKILCKNGCFVTENDTVENKNSQIFQTRYFFSNECSRKAIIARINPEKTEQIVSKYYNHLDGLYNNKNIYNNLQDTDKILLLSKLTKKRQDTLKINQIHYIAELMEYYYEQFMYLNAIKQGESLLETRIVNNHQLNEVSHKFWVIFFKALLAIGDYEKVLEYRRQFEDEDLNFYIATALYNYGRPTDALELLESELCGTVKYKGNVYNLTASIYDWLGNNKKSADSFKKALVYGGNDELKYQLYKKYSMYIDFRIPECQEKLDAAVEYYKSRNLKQYAECLHNYGTGCVMIKDFNKAKKYLESSIDILNKICANEIYYPLNSLAILHCYDGGKYEVAIDILKKALKCDIDITFCELAIHNNLFNIGININDIDFSKAEKNILETLLKKACADLRNISNARPDIQHQLRQFYYNCALLDKLENNNEGALEFFVKAKKCSSYHSVVLYAIEKNIVDLKAELDKKKYFKKFRIKKLPAPTEQEKFIYENNSYMCEIMFWG